MGEVFLTLLQQTRKRSLPASSRLIGSRAAQCLLTGDAALGRVLGAVVRVLTRGLPPGLPPALGSHCGDPEIGVHSSLVRPLCKAGRASAFGAPWFRGWDMVVHMWSVHV